MDTESHFCRFSLQFLSMESHRGRHMAAAHIGENRLVPSEAYKAPGSGGAAARCADRDCDDAASAGVYQDVADADAAGVGWDVDEERPPFVFVAMRASYLPATGFPALARVGGGNTMG